MCLELYFCTVSWNNWLLLVASVICIYRLIDFIFVIDPVQSAFVNAEIAVASKFYVHGKLQKWGWIMDYMYFCFLLPMLTWVNGRHFMPMTKFCSMEYMARYILCCWSNWPLTITGFFTITFEKWMLFRKKVYGCEQLIHGAYFRFQ